MKKIILPIAVLFLTASALTGCASVPSDSKAVDGYGGDASIKSVSVDTADGRTVQCVTLLGAYKGSLDCDWDNTK